MLYSNDNIYTVGLTGMSGAGKSTASLVFVDHGFAVIDCDIVSRLVVSPGSHALRAITARFSEDILTADGTLDRRKLGGIVFGAPEKLAALNDIIYPYITYRIICEIKKFAERGRDLIMLDAPTLFESGADMLCDAVVSITADRSFCVKRITERDGLTPEQAEKRLSSQHDTQFYKERSDYCAENSGSLEDLEAEVAKIAQACKEHRR